MFFVDVVRTLYARFKNNSRAYEKRIKSAHVAFDKRVEENGCEESKIASFDVKQKLGVTLTGTNYKAVQDGSFYLIKVMKKKEIRKRNGINQVVNEKKFSHAMESRFVVHLVSKAKDIENLYLIFEYPPYGNLSDLRQMNNKFDENVLRVLVYQVVLGLEYVHACRIIHRNLCPKSVWVFCGGRLKIADFGYAVTSLEVNKEAVGMPMYRAPEMMRNQPYDVAVDWWALGILICMTGLGIFPFGLAIDLDTVYSNVLKNPLRGVHESDLSEVATDFIEDLLDKDASTRLGGKSREVNHVKSHPWLKQCQLWEYTDYSGPLIKLNYGITGEAVQRGIFDHLAADEVDPLRADFAEF